MGIGKFFYLCPTCFYLLEIFTLELLLLPIDFHRTLPLSQKNTNMVNH